MRAKQHRKFGRFNRAFGLLLLGAAAGLAAYFVFPRDSAVSAQGGIPYINLSASFVPSSLNIAEAPNNAVDGLDVNVDLYDSKNLDTGTAITFEVPRTAFGRKGCPSSVQCSAPASDNNFRFVSYRTSRNWRFRPSEVGTDQAYVLHFHARIPDIGYGMSENAEYMSVESAWVKFAYFDPGLPTASYKDEIVPVSFSEYIPNASSYSAWTSGSVPINYGAYSTWQYESASSGDAVVNSGVSLAVQDQNEKMIFIAGALLGIGGGALVGAIQEAIKND
jgi:hypothetical protein